MEPVRSTLVRIGAGVALGAALGLLVALGLAFGLSIRHTPGLLGNLVAAGTAATCFLFASRTEGALEAVSLAIFGVVAGGAVHAVSARFFHLTSPWGLMGLEEDVPLAEIPLFYAPIVGIVASLLVFAIPRRKAP